MESANQIRELRVNLNSFLAPDEETTVKGATKLVIEGYLNLRVPARDMPTPCYLKIDYITNLDQV